MSFGLCNWFAKDEYEKCKEIDAATARAMVKKSIEEQIKSGIAKVNQDIYNAADSGITSCYTYAFDYISANEASDAIKENLENRGFEVDVMSGRISWKVDMATVEMAVAHNGINKNLTIYKGENKHDNNL